MRVRILFGFTQPCAIESMTCTKTGPVKARINFSRKWKTTFCQRYCVCQVPYFTRRMCCIRSFRSFKHLMRTRPGILKWISLNFIESIWARSWRARDWGSGLAAWQVGRRLVDYRVSGDLQIPLAGKVSHCPIHNQAPTRPASLINRQDQTDSQPAREPEQRPGHKPLARAMVEMAAPARECKVTSKAWQAESVPRWEVV